MASSSDQPQGPDAARESLSPEISRTNTMEWKASPRSGGTKAVSIAEPDAISPLMLGKHKELDQSEFLDLDKSARQYRASVSGKRLSGRPSLERLGSRGSIIGNPSLTSLISDGPDIANAPPEHRHAHESLLKNVQAWLKHEKERRAARKAKRKSKGVKHETKGEEQAVIDEAEVPSVSEQRRGSDSSEGSVALEHLAHILQKSLSRKSTDGSLHKRKSSKVLSSIMKRGSVVGSDSDYFESIDQLVPNCEAVLDNSKTMSYTGGGADSPDENTKDGSIASKKNKEAWDSFKYEILRIAHTLKLKGWRRVPLDQSNEIEVERLSGALTNAVYVVSPPRNLKSQQEKESEIPTPKNPPPKLLLRIYGPQVEHLIDREAELQILRRLARKRIGPRLLGTFTNGRFEEFLHAITLTAKDLRVPETSKQIAKRMRELHEGIDLLPKERDDGPFVWRNWDKWVNRCEQVLTWLDQQIVANKGHRPSSAADAWKQRGYVCGVEWPVFRRTVEKYRKWLEDQYGGIEKLNQRLIFAHNDTQYGNILRLIPAGESPLLLPANEHKQLVVIDFEYANANLPGLEFANHFTEWCYNYHDPDYSFACNTRNYPTVEEQHRFIRAYLLHNPTFKAPGRSTSPPPTPHFGPLTFLPHSGSTTALAATSTPSTISSFMLDSRGPPGEKRTYDEQEAQAEQQTEEEIKRLMSETRLWRLANSAHWVAWGIVQANVAGMPDFDTKAKEEEGAGTSQQSLELESATTEMRNEAEAEKKAEGGEEEEDAEDEFDYLAYSQERAMFFWGDAIKLGIIEAEELPEDVRQAVKIVEF